VPIYVELLDQDGRPVRRLPDPSGGTFDAAGDFDRFIDTSHVGYPEEVPLPCLQSVDPYSDTEMASDAMPQLVRDLDLAVRLGKDGSEKRGLLRLKVMAEHCAEREGSSLLWRGD
jgi:hypothetical protein